MLTLAANAERAVQEGVRHADNGASFLSLNPVVAQRLVQNINAAVENAVSTDGQPALLVNPVIRPHLAQLVTRFLPNVPVISRRKSPRTSVCSPWAWWRRNNKAPLVAGPPCKKRRRGQSGPVSPFFAPVAAR